MLEATACPFSGSRPGASSGAPTPSSSLHCKCYFSLGEEDAEWDVVGAGAAGTVTSRKSSNCGHPGRCRKERMVKYSFVPCVPKPARISPLLLMMAHIRERKDVFLLYKENTLYTKKFVLISIWAGGRNDVPQGVPSLFTTLLQELCRSGSKISPMKATGVKEITFKYIIYSKEHTHQVIYDDLSPTFS